MNNQIKEITEYVLSEIHSGILSAEEKGVGIYKDTVKVDFSIREEENIYQFSIELFLKRKNKRK